MIVAGLYMVVWGKSKDKELCAGMQVSPEEHILDKECQENGCHKVITIKSSDEECDTQNETVDVIVNVEPSIPSVN